MTNENELAMSDTARTLSELEEYRIQKVTEEFLHAWANRMYAVLTVLVLLFGGLTVWSTSTYLQLTAERRAQELFQVQSEKLQLLNESAAQRDFEGKALLKELESAKDAVRTVQLQINDASAQLQESKRLIEGHYDDIAQKLSADPDLTARVAEVLAPAKLNEISEKVDANIKSLEVLRERIKFITVEAALIDGKSTPVTSIRGPLKVFDHESDGFLLIRNLGESKLRSQNGERKTTKINIENP